MSELPPARVRGQRSGKCRTCDGALRYYPRPGVDEDTADAETVGQWAHMSVLDWRDNPHEPDPIEDEEPAP